MQNILADADAVSATTTTPTGGETAIKMQIPNPTKPASFTPAIRTAIEAAAGAPIIGIYDKTGVQVWAPSGGGRRRTAKRKQKGRRNTKRRQAGGALKSYTSMTTYTVVFGGTVNPTTLNTKIAANSLIKSAVAADVKTTTVPGSSGAPVSGGPVDSEGNPISVGQKVTCNGKTFVVKSISGTKVNAPVVSGGKSYEGATCSPAGAVADIVDSQGNPIAKGMKVTCGTIVKPYTVYSVKNNKVYSSAADGMGRLASTCTVSDGSVPETTPPDTGPGAGPDAGDESGGPVDESGGPVDEPVVGPEGSTDNGDGTFTAEDGSIVDSTGNPLQEDPDNPGKYLTAEGTPFVAPKPKVGTRKTGSTGKTGNTGNTGNTEYEEGEGDDTAVCGIAGVTGGPGGTTAKFAPKANSAVPIQISAEQLPEGQLISPVAEWSNGDIKHSGNVSYIFTGWEGKVYCITGADANEISKKVSTLKKQTPITLTKEVLDYMMSEFNESQLGNMRESSNLLGLLKVSSNTADSSVQPTIKKLQDTLVKDIETDRAVLQTTQNVMTAAAAAGGGRTRKRRPHSKSYKSGRKYAKKSAKKSAKRR